MSSKHHRTYEDFEPPVERSEEDGCTILTLYIPGFSKEQIQVQVFSRKKLRISGERRYKNSKHAWQRFHKEFEIPSNCDTANITAKYKGGILHVRQPILQDQSKPHTQQQQADKPILEQTNQTNSAANGDAPVTVDDAPVTDTPNINKQLTMPTGRRRLKEMIPGVFLKLVLPIFLAAVLLLFWYAKRLNPTVSVEVLGESPK